jgi:hypothetical protein
MARGERDKPARRTGERSSTPRRRSSMASMSMKLLLPNAAVQLQAVDSTCGNQSAAGSTRQAHNPML